jgi:hypothetical protein
MPPEALKGRLPATAPPEQALAKLDADGRLRVWRSIAVYEPVTVLLEGQATTSYAMRKTLGQSRYPLDVVRAFDTQGKEVDRKELARKLEHETLVLVCPGRAPPEMLHLRLVKEGTLVLALPNLAVAAPPTIAAPAIPAAPPAATPRKPEPTMPALGR